VGWEPPGKGREEKERKVRRGKGRERKGREGGKERERGRKGNASYTFQILPGRSGAPGWCSEPISCVPCIP